MWSWMSLSLSFSPSLPPSSSSSSFFLLSPSRSNRVLVRNNFSLLVACMQAKPNGKTNTIFSQRTLSLLCLLFLSSTSFLTVCVCLSLARSLPPFYPFVYIHTQAHHIYSLLLSFVRMTKKKRGEKVESLDLLLLSLARCRRSTSASGLLLLLSTNSFFTLILSSHHHCHQHH